MKKWQLQKEKVNRRQRSSSPLNQCHHQKQNHSMSRSKSQLPSLGMSWNRDLQFWFAFKSVSFITGPSTSVDERDVIDVTDPVRSIAAQALADLGYQPQPQPQPQ